MQVVQPPSDGISALAWSPKQNYMVATSWDQQLRCYEVQPNGSSSPRASAALEAPPLCCAWHHEGGAVFVGGCDKQAKRWDLASGAAPSQVAAHDAPIRHLAWVPELQMLVTGGWDKQLRYWDLRQQAPAFSHTLPERCYGLSCVHPLLVVATAERHFQVFNLNNPQTVYKSLQSPLKYQTRCVAAFPDKTGFLVGSIEGRVAVHHVEEQMAAKNFTFKCHRDADGSIHAVNSTIEFLRSQLATKRDDGSVKLNPENVAAVAAGGGGASGAGQSSGASSP